MPSGPARPHFAVTIPIRFEAGVDFATPTIRQWRRSTASPADRPGSSVRRGSGSHTRRETGVELVGGGAPPELPGALDRQRGGLP
jgi:hypothetical protein